MDNMILGRLLCWLILVMSVSAQFQRQPNIVFIMVDDMGWSDVSFHGSDQILTPNIDSLAYHGVILQQYYSEAICTPARTALLTGKYPMRLGMQGQPLLNSEDRGIPLTERLLPSYLKELGYSTHLIGKWHVGMSRREYLPTSRGYDTHYGMRGGFVDYYTYNKVEGWPNGQQLFGLDLFDNDLPQTNEQRYIVDALTDQAVKIIHRHNGSRPLFLHMTHNAPHSGNGGGALQPPLYSSVKNQHIANSDRRLYAEIVSHIDRSIGKVIKSLAETGMIEDTIIVFASDNGAPTVGDLRNWGVNLPLRGKKDTPWEGGVRVPALIWHSSLRSRVWNGLMHISDWMPTLIAAAGGRVDREIDGVNQWDSIIKDGQSQRKEVLLSVVDSDTNSYAAYRAGDYKVIVGNVTGLSNDYYGQEFLRNKSPPPQYYPAVKSCEVSKIFEYMGFVLPIERVTAMRNAATVKPLAQGRDRTPCVPTPSRGCLYNVREDPTESRDLWQRANNIATLLVSRLRGLWAMQMRRGPVNLSPASDPANFEYIWMPWMSVPNSTNGAIEVRSNGQLCSNNRIAKNHKGSTVAAVINCDGTSGIRNFLCILRSVF